MSLMDDSGIYAIHHNPEYFPEPYEFRPERWLGRRVESTAAATEDGKKSHSGLMTFSLGPRGCLGRSMAYKQLNLVIARTLFAYDFCFAQAPLGRIGGGDAKNQLRHHPDEFQLFSHITSYCDGPWLQFRRREGNSQ